MQPILDQLGIDRSVKEMSQAEKEILRYIATLRQARVAMGDFANTAESPSNQMKIFKQQLVESKVAMTSLFIGTFSEVLPYANAFLMVVKEVSKAIASMFGIELSDYNSGIASAEDAYVDFGDSVSDAADAVKELKRQTLGFDQINNITENKDSGSGSSGGVSGGIDQRLLDAINGYDNGMDRVRMKATEIRDKIMEWLGFHKQIDPLTGETVWKLKDGYSNLKLIGGIIGTLVGFKLVKGITGLITGTSKLGKLLGTGGLYSTLKKINEPIKVLGTKDGLKYIFLEGTSTLKKFLPVLGKTSLGLGGLATTIVGTKGVYDSMKKITVEGEASANSLGKFSISMTGAVAGGAALGSVIPGVGTAIGALGGALVGVTASLVGYHAGVVQLAKSELFGNINVSTEEWTEILRTNGMQISSCSDLYDNLKTKLESLSATFIENSEKVDLMNYKYSLLGQTMGVDSMNEIISSVNNMCDATSEAIEENTNYHLQLWGDFFTKRGTLNDEENRSFLNNIISYGNNQKTELKNTQDSITATYQNAINSRGYLTEEEYNYIQEQLNKIRNLTQEQMSQANTEITYWKQRIANDSLAIDEESYSNLLSAMETYQKEQEQKIEENYNLQLNSLKTLHKNGEIEEKEYNKKMKEIFNNRRNDESELAGEIASIRNDVMSGLMKKYVELRDDTSSKAKEMKKIMEEIFKNFNIDTSELKHQSKTAGELIGDNFSSGISNNLRVDGKNLYSSWNSTLSKFDKTIANNSLNLSNPFSSLKVYGYANGGFPEDGWFRASHGEIMGEFDNGKSVVANNQQIVAGIEEAAYRGYMRAISESGATGGSSQIDVHVHTDEGTVVDRINQRTKQTGVCPINIPC